MSVSGLTTCNPSRSFFHSTTTTPRGLRAPCERVSVSGKKKKDAVALRLESRNYWTGGFSWRQNVQRTHKIKSAMDASFGGIGGGAFGAEIFPRINIKDPYKRLGISKEASEEEIQAARNFLILRYSGHKPSVDAIESAHDKIIMEKFYERRRPKLNIKKNMREFTRSHIMQAFTDRFRTPSTNFMIKTGIVFVILGVLTVLYPTEEGPTLQVAISLLATMYFIHSRLRSKMRAVLYGAGAFAVSWLLGTFLMVSVVPPILPGPRSLEVTTALVSYALLWVSSTYLK